MKRSIGIFLFCLTIMQYTALAGSKADSLEALLGKTATDTGRITIFTALASELANQNPDKAIAYAEKGIGLSRKIAYRKGEASLRKELGVIYMYNGDHSKAIACFLDAMKIFEDMEDAKGIAACNGNIGIVYWYQNNRDKSLEYYGKALEQYELLGDKVGIANQYNNMGLVYSEQKKYDQAIELYKKSLVIYEELGNKQGVAKRLNNIGIVYEEKGDHAEALQYYREALGLRELLGDVQGMVISLNNLGDLLSKTGSHKEALKHLERSLRHSKEIGFLEGQRYACEYLANTYARLNDHKNAFEYHQQYMKVNDSIRSNEIHEQMAEMEAKYQNEKKEKEIIRLNEEKARNELTLIREQTSGRIKTLVIMAISLFLLASLFAFRIYYMRRKAKEQEIRKQIGDYIHEIELLKAGILPLSAVTNKTAAVTLDKEELNTRLVNPLTDREVEVINLVAEGRSNKEIAERLFISENTVKYHLKNIYEKLDAKNRTEALAKAGAMNLVSGK